VRYPRAAAAAVSTVAVLVLVDLANSIPVVATTPAHATPPLLFPVGGSAKAGDTLTLVPAPSGTPSGCANATLSNPYPDLASGRMSLNGNLFNLPVGSVGGSSFCYDSSRRTLSDSTQFTSLPGAVLHGVLGYPEAILGQNIYGGITGASDAVLPLPHDQVRDLTSQDLWVRMNYSVEERGSSPYDFAFDDWFSEYRANSSSTGNVGDRIELMIWLSNDIGMYLNQTRVAVPTFFNGSAAPGTWYRDQLCQSSDFLTFDYLYAPSGTTPGYGAASGRIAFNLTYILDNVAKVVRAGTCWAGAGTQIGGLYADNFPLGAEFYPTALDTSSVSWTVSSLCYRFVAGTPTASLRC
jgi:hypothetical protein